MDFCQPPGLQKILFKFSGDGKFKSRIKVNSVLVRDLSGLVDVPEQHSVADQPDPGFTRRSAVLVLADERCLLESGWEFTKLLTQIRKIFLNFKVFLQSSYSLKIGTL